VSGRPPPAGDAAAAGPPSFAEARNRRQKVRAAGLDPDHWYAVEYEDRLAPGQVVEVRFWGRSIALFRGADGRLRALENRCAHRQLALSLGEVTGCALTCAYHGWRYDGDDGRLVGVPHDLFGHPMPGVRVAVFPVQPRYGLVWLFPGDPTLAGRRSVPAIPELEGPDPWAYVPLAFTWRAHHSMVMDNLCDLTHAHLHRRFPSFQPGRLLACEPDADRVVMRYEARIGPLAQTRRARPRTVEIAYEYPYHRARFAWSNVEGAITYWTLLLPLDARTTRVFFVFCYDRLRLPFLPVPLGRRLVRALLRLTKPVVVPLLRRDGFALEAEQDGWERHFDAPMVELNPVVPHLHELTVRKWEAHLARAGGPGAVPVPG
jgi:phenylpropionate dioxygenase-like ring-hydroxylating dioxygenase large terminal subunit